MNGVEALIAMQNGLIVQEEISGLQYKIEDGIVFRTVRTDKGDGWTESSINLNVWLSRHYHDPYTLTFFEAMVEAEKGHKVRNEEHDGIYHMKGGILYNEGGGLACIYEFEMDAKWKVVKKVETEESE